MMPENPDRPDTPSERVDVLTDEINERIAQLIQIPRTDGIVLTNEINERIAQLIHITWTAGIHQGLEAAAQVANVVAETSWNNDNEVGKVTAEFIRDQARLMSLQTPDDPSSEQIAS